MLRATGRGAFEQADGGTLFLDEIGECDLAMQTKLLRVLQPPERTAPCRRVFQRVGDLQERHGSVRVIAATNRDLLATVNNSQFREDLYYRLAVITVKPPPLRDRQGDITRIVEHRLTHINGQFEEEEPGITNPLTVIEHIALLTFARLLDMRESTKQKKFDNMNRGKNKKFPGLFFSSKQQHMRLSVFSTPAATRVFEHGPAK